MKILDNILVDKVIDSGEYLVLTDCKTIDEGKCNETEVFKYYVELDKKGLGIVGDKGSYKLTIEKI